MDPEAPFFKIFDASNHRSEAVRRLISTLKSPAILENLLQEYLTQFTVQKEHFRSAVKRTPIGLL